MLKRSGLIFVLLVFVSGCGKDILGPVSNAPKEAPPTAEQLLHAKADDIDRRIGTATRSLPLIERLSRLEGETGTRLAFDGGLVETLATFFELYDVRQEPAAGIVAKFNTLEKKCGIPSDPAKGLVVRKNDLVRYFESQPEATRIGQRMGRILKTISRVEAVEKKLSKNVQLGNFQKRVLDLEREAALGDKSHDPMHTRLDAIEAVLGL